MKRIRILLVEVPRMIQESLAGILDEQEDMEVVSLPMEPRSLSQAVALARCDVVLVEMTTGKPFGETQKLLHENPGLRVVSLANHGREISMTELVPETVELGQVSPIELIEAIRRPFSWHNAS